MSIVFGLKNLGMMLIFFVEFYSEMCFFVCVFSKVMVKWVYRDWETDRKSTRLNSSH